mmetsp:Transcript_36135/g.116368  ORF Transcript_36135/g.116368 Transcript_36135/m.116368 type:complete len:131 (+) Transcript_36135:33-425(+)
MIQTEAADDTARRTTIKPLVLVVSIIGALALVGSLSTGAATREASLDLDLGAVEKELPIASPPPEVAAAKSPKKAGKTWEAIREVYKEMEGEVDKELAAKDPWWKYVENDEEGHAKAPQILDEEQWKQMK